MVGQHLVRNETLSSLFSKTHSKIVIIGNIKNEIPLNIEFSLTVFNKLKNAVHDNMKFISI